MKGYVEESVKISEYPLIRGIPLPSEKINKNNTVAGVEFKKAKRSIGNLSRSFCLASGYKDAQPYCSVGYCVFNPDFKKFVSIAVSDKNTGGGAKIEHQYAKRLDEEKAKEKLKKIKARQEQGHDSNFNNSKHSEIQYDVHIDEISGIYFYEGVSYINNVEEGFSRVIEMRSSRPSHFKLQAIFMQQEFKRIHGKELDIYCYTTDGLATSSFTKCTFTNDEIVDLWKATCFQYDQHKEILDTYTDLKGYSIEEMKVQFVYGQSYSSNQNLLLPVDQHYEEELKNKINLTVKEYIRSTPETFERNLSLNNELMLTQPSLIEHCKLIINNQKDFQGNFKKTLLYIRAAKQLKLSHELIKEFAHQYLKTEQENYYATSFHNIKYVAKYMEFDNDVCKKICEVFNVNIYELCRNKVGAPRVNMARHEILDNIFYIKNALLKQGKKLSTEQIDAFKSIFGSNENRIPFVRKLYSHRNLEFGTLPDEYVQKFASVMSKLITNNPNPKLIKYYLNKIRKTTFPNNAYDILHNYTSKTEEAQKILEEFKQAFTTSKILEITKKALEYSYDKHLSQPYKKEKGTCFPVICKRDREVFIADDKYGSYKKGDYDSKIVYRSNHGLAHTARTLAMVPEVLAFNIKYAREDVLNFLQEQTSTPNDKQKFIAKLQIAMAFYVSGREGEHGWGTNEYNKYREASKKFFIEYVKSDDDTKALFKNEDEIELYGSCLEHSYVTDEDLKGCTNQIAIKALLYGSHCVDLVRIWKPKKVQGSTVFDLLKAVPKDKIEQAKHDAFLVFHKAAQLCRIMGDSLYTEYDSQTRKCKKPDIKYEEQKGAFKKTNFKRFLEYSTNVSKSFNLIYEREAEAEAEAKALLESATKALEEAKQKEAEAEALLESAIKVLEEAKQKEAEAEAEVKAQAEAKAYLERLKAREESAKKALEEAKQKEAEAKAQAEAAKKQEDRNFLLCTTGAATIILSSVLYCFRENLFECSASSSNYILNNSINIKSSVALRVAITAAVLGVIAYTKYNKENEISVN
ncbi:MAG: SidE phosphodiesterase domain-containing protein [Candidatus Jidaibacter sp.]|jgi:hypothetical protein|nr:SidE phosphodiesterase domain-containing protein [Candidatus Jidaibacter sp.]